MKEAQKIFMFRRKIIMILLISINIFIIFKPQTAQAAYYVIWSKDNNAFDCVPGSKVSEQNPPLSDSYATLDFCKTEITTIKKLGFCIADQKIGAGKTCRPYFTHQKLDNMFKECDSPLQKFSTLQECQDVLNPQPKKAEIKWQPVVPTFQIKIPNMKEYTNTDIEELKKTEKTGEGEFVFIPFLARYISDIYRWALLIAGIVLLVMILIGGFIYMTSAGNAERAKAGKDRIASAVLGFCLLLISYSLLYVINPELVGLKSLKIKVVPREEVPENFDLMKTPSGGPACKGLDNPSKPSPDGDKQYLGRLDSNSCGTRDLKNIIYVVLHEGGSKTKSTVSIFKKRNVSSHYSIDRDGKVYQLVGEERTAWHAGAINQFSIGIDLSITNQFTASGKCPLSSCTWTEAQYTAVNNLVNSILNRISVTKDSNSVIGHCQVSDTDHTDPRNFDWSKIGLNNVDHYENASDLGSKCKIIFNYAEKKEALNKMIPGSTDPSGCCFIYSSKGEYFEPFVEETTDQACTDKEKELQLANPSVGLAKSWAKKACAQK